MVVVVVQLRRLCGGGGGAQVQPSWQTCSVSTAAVRIVLTIHGTLAFLIFIYLLFVKCTVK